VGKKATFDKQSIEFSQHNTVKMLKYMLINKIHGGDIFTMDESGSLFCEICQVSVISDGRYKDLVKRDHAA